MKGKTQLEKMLQAARKEKPAELVLKNATYLNVFTNTFYQTDIAIEAGYFVGLGQYNGITELDCSGKTIVPSFWDAHMHLESAVVTPEQYAKAVVPHGTGAIVADPHEIANVLGTVGIDYLLRASEDLALKVYFTISSCVPATEFDESGARIDAAVIEKYLRKKRVLGLAEVMDYPGVIQGNPDMMRKLLVTQKTGKRLDGHAPGLIGAELDAYCTAGIASDHECSTAQEAMEKLKRGQWIMIREGTACHNLEKLVSLLQPPYDSRCLLVTDDKHPSELLQEGHIDHCIRKAIALGANPISAYKAATINAAEYFGIPDSGAIAPGYQADFVVLEDVEQVLIHSVYQDGRKVADRRGFAAEGDAFAEKKSKRDEDLLAFQNQITNTVHIGKVTGEDLRQHTFASSTKVIGLVSGEILTRDEGEAAGIDVDQDIIKLAVVERHHQTGHIATCFLKGLGLKAGAIATTIAHDSHNIIVAGCNEEDMALAIMRLKTIGGGMVIAKDGDILAELALPIAGLMCDRPVEEVEKSLKHLKDVAHFLGVVEGVDPFMTLSFTSLPVIPTLRLTTLGVVDVTRFCFLSV